MMRATLTGRIGRQHCRVAAIAVPVCAAAILVGLSAAPCRAADEDTCLVISAENIVTGAGNFYLYVEISDKPYTFARDDQLEYEILLPALNPALQGGVDADLRSETLAEAVLAAPCLRDRGLKDQNGIPLHGKSVLEPARDQWYHRTFDLSSLAGQTAERWDVAFEGDQPGRYVQCLANIRITRDSKTVFTIYAGGRAPEPKVRLNEGYSGAVLITTAPRGAPLNGPALEALLAQARRHNEMRVARDHFHTELSDARALLTSPRVRPPDNEARAMWVALATAAGVEDVVAFDAGDDERYSASLLQAHEALAPLDAYMRDFTGHLVGHAHIDLQWLWSWDETVNRIIPDTFGQALKFMQEFPEFTFLQSSAALYLATEQHHPELFKQIQDFARKGRWEIVGGRWCEGDLNMISPESHARHFLYAQRYFQQKFGRICTDGWEPDTFGHPWTLPQLLRQAGLRSYYFCRGWSDRPGRKGGPPLFWWEGPDGSKVLAFDESALNSWYIGTVNDDKVRLLTEFADKTGAHDYLMVYGVGNHGGGPTRENIQAAVAMQTRRPWPLIKFSTVGAFFGRAYGALDQLNIPTIRSELNPVFEGCYTTHSRIKKYNRDSESLLESAEVFAALAARGAGAASRGFTYPHDDFEGLWRDVLWNHHHDTLDGSFVHASSEYSAQTYEALLARGRDIRLRAQGELARGLEPGPGDTSVIVVFNPLAWPRTEVVEATIRVPLTSRLTMLHDEEGDLPADVLQRKLDGEHIVMRICFAARNVPACGYKVFRNRGPAAASLPPLTEADVLPREPGQRGPVEPPPREQRAHFQVLHEKPHGMSAWEVGEIDRMVELEPAGPAQVLENGEVRRRVRQAFVYGPSTITQDTLTYPDRQRVEYETTVEWQQVGNAQDGSDMLKVAFQTGIESGAATYEVPFGDVARPTDGHEDVALKWCDLSDAARGLTVLNDCKHAYDVKGGVIRLTLLRSSYEPDPKPDVGTHRMRFAAVARDTPLDKATAARAGWEFNQPLEVLVLDPSADKTGSPRRPPAQWSGCQVEPANVILTCLKPAEDHDGLILRAYECAGRASTATLTLGFDAQGVTETDLLERDLSGSGRVGLAGQLITAQFKPYEIRTFRVRP